MSEGRVDVMAMAIADSSSDEFPVPDGNSRQFLSEYGDFPVFLVNRHLRLTRVTTYQLYPHRAKLAASAARREAAPKRRGEPTDEGIVQASRDTRKKKVGGWGVEDGPDERIRITRSGCSTRVFDSRE